MDEITDVEDSTAATDWSRIETLFPTRNALMPSAAWMNGMSSRLATGRLSRLSGTRQSGRLAAILDQCEDGRIKALRTYAAINLEQATSAFRLTMIANVTAPIVLVSVTHQLIEGGLGTFLANLFEGDARLIGFMILIGGLVAAMLLVLAFYSLANLNQARDIRHLIDLHAADRGIYFGLEDADDLHSP